MRYATDMKTNDPPRACEWPDGCARGAFRTVLLDGHPRALCLRHCGAVWNARKRANRAAGRCACGAEPTPGYRTCERCRAVARTAKRRERNVNRLAAECGITLPRQAGRRSAFLSAYCEAFNRSQRAAHRASRRRGGLLGPVAVQVAMPWEGHQVTVQAVAGRAGFGPPRGVVASAS